MKIRTGLLFLTLSLIACSGSYPAKKKTQVKYTANVGQSIGNVTIEGYQELVYRVLEGRYQFTILRFREIGNRFIFETDWQHRAPFMDEAELGAEEAKTKIVGEARSLVVSSGGGKKINTIAFIGETMLSLKPGEWVLKPPTDMAKKLVKSCFDDLELEISSKMRIF